MAREQTARERTTQRRCPVKPPRLGKRRLLTKKRRRSPTPPPDPSSREGPGECVDGDEKNQGDGEGP